MQKLIEKGKCKLKSARKAHVKFLCSLNKTQLDNEKSGYTAQAKCYKVPQLKFQLSSNIYNIDFLMNLMGFFLMCSG